MGNEIRAGKAFVEFSIKDSIGKGLERIKRQLADVGHVAMSAGKMLAGVGAGITAPLLFASHEFAEMGDQITKAANRTGVGVGALQELKYAAEQSDVSFEDLQGSIGKIQKTLAGAASGGKEQAEALSDLGLSISDLSSLSPDKQFELIADKLADITDPAVRASRGMAVFGKSFQTLLPLIEEGADGMKELRERARELGLVFSDEDVANATAFGDIVSDLTKQLKALVFTVGATIGEALQPFAEGATKVLRTVIDWVNANRPLILILASVGAGLVVAGTALIGLGVALSIASTAIGGLISAWGGLVAVFTLLTNPVVLVGAALAGLVIWFGYATEAGQATVGFLVGKFNELKNVAYETFGGIADALKAGDISLAANILWVGLQLAWANGTAELMAKWYQFKAGFVQVAAAAFYGVLDIYAKVKASLFSAFENTTSFLSDLWDGFTGTFAKSWDDTIGQVAKGMLYIQSLFDDSINYQDAADQIDNENARREADRRKQESEAAAKNEAELKKALEDIESEKQAALKANSDAELGLSAGASQNAKDDITALEEKRKALQAELDKLRGKAADERKESQPPEEPKKKKGPDLGDLEAAQTSTTSIKSAGVFNSAAIRSLEGNAGLDFLRRTAKATEDMNNKLGKLIMPAFT